MLLFLHEIITITLKQTETHCIQTETFLPLALQSFIATIQRNWDTIFDDVTVATVSILLSRLCQLHPINFRDAAKMMEHCNILWRSTHNPMAVWHTNIHTLMLIVLEFQFTCLIQVCLNLTIYLFMIYTINIWSSLSANPQLIFTISSPMD